MTGEAPLDDPELALAEGRWQDARAGFEARLTGTGTAADEFGLAMALWWLGENRASVEHCGRAYAAYRRTGVREAAARCAVWLAITYKANFANTSAADGWLGRADRLLAPVEVGPLHAWVWVARAYRLADLDEAEVLTARALDVATAAGDVDLELVALAQLGLVMIGRGQTVAGFVLLDEALAVVLAGEGTTLDTVVHTCCDMLTACDLVSDLDRAARWCEVADDFVAAHGCPFLYAECRVYYGGVLTAKGRWKDADRELAIALQLTAGVCPGLQVKALVRLADLRIRQGRLEDAAELLDEAGATGAADPDEALALASLLLARQDAAGSIRTLLLRRGQVAEHPSRLASALDLLVEARLAGGDPAAAASAAAELGALAARSDSPRLSALAARATGRVAGADGEVALAAERLGDALAGWAALALPFELAIARADLAQLLATEEPDVAIDHDRRALATLDRLGAHLAADRVAAHLRSLGVVARTGAKSVGILTEREQEVAQLVGLGLTNPEIAARLHVSRKTAAHHVSSILTKLGLRNRAQVAVHIAARTDEH